MSRLLKIILAILIFNSSFFILVPHANAATGEWEGSVLTNFVAGTNMMLYSGCPARQQAQQNPNGFAAITWSEDVSLENHIFKCSEDMVGAGLINTTTQGIALLLEYQPVSSKEYLADIGSRLSPTPALAQRGTGAVGLLPVLILWRAFRNIAYIFYILMFVVIGLMIMFRSKIDPQTIVSIQAALPNLIVSLLLITFSYAIAGFLIDLMYWAIYILVATFDAAGILDLPGGDATQYTLRNFIFNRNLSQWGEMVDSSKHLISSAVSNIAGGLDALAEFYVRTVYWSLLGTFAFGVAIIISLLKAILELIKAYMMVILYVITGPIQLLTNAVPGSQAFITWIRCLAGHLAVFPAVAAFLLIGSALLGQAPNRGAWPPFAPGIGYEATNNATNFVPPFIIADGATAIEGTSGLQIIQGLLGIAIILLLPGVIEMVKERFGCKTADYGKIIQENYREGEGLVTGIFRKGGSAYGSFQSANIQGKALRFSTFIDILRNLFMP